ncbi:hypothetical protein GR160_05550 [Flavobacterium sp. Sd200]|uniref:diflavin oxidoreductase n=1 Tax=Flavobacterium sp. Sd200 TaxID=2692211 RepID=UPI00136BFE3C|nr:flavodoxin domain-containing protein [Flavobacterium sp. Sd200]MXN90684.1 hypothetical protein [Flavobacterium sp. Sd200]
MLSEGKKTLLQQLVLNASKDELIWINGYVSGLLESSGTTFAPQTEVPHVVAVKPTIIYGTETGNSKKVSSQILTGFKKNKIQAKSIDVFQYDVAKLAKETHVLFIMSTQGEGEFPQNAQAFYDKLSNSDINLSHLKYAVLGLGDTSYPLYCYAGELLDAALEKLGAQRLLPLVKADVDYAETVAQWESHLKSAFESEGKTQATNTSISKSTAPTSHKTYYKGSISHKVILNDRGSNKETYHIEIQSEDVVSYEPGDALGIVPFNDEYTIQKILSYFKEDGSRKITLKDRTETINQWLAECNVKGLSKRSIGQIASLLETVYDAEKADLNDILAVVDIPAKVTIDSIIELLLPIAPRLYSISSSIDAHDGEVHLTVTLDTFKVKDELREGLASNFLAHFPLNTPFDFYIHKNNNFRLPADDKDIIMIGPGTGIAPFRSFISHRDAIGAEGKNWLFFGEQHFVLDFYYQTEIQEWLTTGVLNKFDVAFSRDQQHKIYVQDRIKEKAAEFDQWLQNGASLYICGQKHPMGTDVENTITEVISAARGISLDDARQVLAELEEQGRYQKDVY